MSSNLKCSYYLASKQVIAMVVYRVSSTLISRCATLHLVVARCFSYLSTDHQNYYQSICLFFPTMMVAPEKDKDRNKKVVGERERESVCV
jgi:UDP-N-acetylmuramyl tripeptide synthase